MQTKTLVIFAFLSASALLAQPKPVTTPWRGAGVVPCLGSDGGMAQLSPHGTQALELEALVK
jgi:imidazolonepropionase-like amidohydrolase